MTLRQVHYDSPRRTELFIIMTMYNGDNGLFTRTMHKAMKNIAYLCKRDRSKTWGKDGWKKVVVCNVSECRQKINLRTLGVIAAIGASTHRVCHRPLTAHPVPATQMAPSHRWVHLSLALFPGALLSPYTYLSPPNSATEEGANDLWTMKVPFAKSFPFATLPNHYRSVKPSVIVPRLWLPPSKCIVMGNNQTLKGFSVRPSSLPYFVSDDPYLVLPDPFRLSQNSPKLYV